LVASPYNHCSLKNLLHIPNEMEVYDMIALAILLTDRGPS
jgi:hypothetical protein